MRIKIETIEKNNARSLRITRKPTIVIRMGAEGCNLTFGGTKFDFTGLDDAGLTGTSRDVCHLTGIV